jgi:ABC-type transporter Mla subunit MlaD
VKLLHEQVFSTANRENLAGALAAIKGAAEELRQLLAADGELHGRALEPLQRLLDSAAATVISVRDTTLPRADHLLDEANGGAQEFRAALAAVQKDLGAVFGQLQGTLLENRPELAESVQRLRSVLWQAEMALRKIRANPAVLLFGSAEQDLEAREFDESGARATGRARIFQQRDERAGGR